MRLHSWKILRIIDGHTPPAHDRDPVHPVQIFTTFQGFAFLPGFFFVALLPFGSCFPVIFFLSV